MQIVLNINPATFNVILQALAQRPYIEVADLIPQLRAEAERQLAVQVSSASTPPAPEAVAAPVKH